MVRIRSNESGLGFFGVVHQIYSFGPNEPIVIHTLCDKKIPFKLKGKFYRTIVRSKMLYGMKCWAANNQHENKVSICCIECLVRIEMNDIIMIDTIRERWGNNVFYDRKDGKK